MKTLSLQEKIRIMENVIEPALTDLDAEIAVACIGDFLKAYINSGDYVNDDLQCRVAMIPSIGIVIRMIDRLGSNYED